MIGLFIILLVMGGSVFAALACIVAGMIWTGRIAIPGSAAHRLHDAKIREQIAHHRASTEAFKLQEAQNVARRQILEAQSVEDLQKIYDENVHKELEAEYE